MNRIYLIVFLFISIIGESQNNTPTYTWRMHQPYNSVRQIIEVKDQLYVLGEVGVYTFGLKSGEIDFLSKVDGFSESEVARIGYSHQYETLVMAYGNGNIDLLKGNNIINLPGILRSSIIGGKKIFEIKIFEKYAYLATSFGVVVIDLDKEEIVDDYQNLGNGGEKLSVNSITLFNDSLFLGTPDGLMVAPANDVNLNLKNFASWQTRTIYDSAVLLTNHDGKLYFVSDSILYSYSNGSYAIADGGVKKKYESIVSTYNKLVICRREGIVVLNEDKTMEERGEPFMQYAMLDFQDNLWFGAFYRGLIKVSSSGQYSYLRPQGPYNCRSYDMAGQGDKMWVTSGGHTSTYAPGYNSYGYYVYEDGRWTNAKNKQNAISDSMLDFTNLLVRKDKDEVWIGSFGTGLMKIVGQKPIIKYDHSNSTIKSALGSLDVVTGVAIDSKEDLWVSNYDTERPLVVKRKDGTWEDFNVGLRNLGEMIVDGQDQVWAAVPRNSNVGIAAMKDLGDGEISVRRLNTSKNSGGLPSNNVRALALDKDGEIWVGTEAGIAVFYNPSLVFEGGVNADAQQIIIDDGSDVGYLLGNEVVNDIKIDGANRKWVATNNGAWLIKEDGSQVITHFTSQNSPLPNNQVNCIGIVPNTGEVFFGTRDCIVSFRGDATEALDVHSNTLVFPNPVHPSYNGPITITGLPEDATVKITDVAGRVVYELIASGGTAIWDGLNFDGQKPHSGVYLILSGNKEDEEALVTKLLFVR